MRTEAEIRDELEKCLRERRDFPVGSFIYLTHSARIDELRWVLGDSDEE